MIHEQGPRADRPFVPVNCGAIPEELMESELFGHKKGSFTGAVADKLGLFQAVDGGTLFLDEVADLPFAMQVKMLRAIQEKCVRPVGVEREVAVDVRILSASHKDLDAMVKLGQFRQDFYYRLNVINLHVPALRERPEDIRLLAEHILERPVKSLVPDTESVGRSRESTWKAIREAKLSDREGGLLDLVYRDYGGETFAEWAVDLTPKGRALFAIPLAGFFASDPGQPWAPN